MSVSKGAASLVDILLLGLFISILLVVSIYFGGDSYQMEVSREEVLYSDTTLMSLMGYRNESFWGYDKIPNATVGDLFEIYYCGDDGSRIYQNQLNETVKWFLDLAVPVNYKYVFWSKDTESERGIHVWRGQKDVCASHITVKSFDYKVSCREDMIPVTMYIWPGWKEIKTKEECLTGG